MGVLPRVEDEWESGFSNFHRQPPKFDNVFAMNMHRICAQWRNTSNSRYSAIPNPGIVSGNLWYRREG
jgi:hypothetical protein